MNILFITNWFPSPDHPGQGIFIQEHAKAIQLQGHNLKIIFIEAIYGKTFYKVIVNEEEDQSGLKWLHIRLVSRFWKFIDNNPWHLYFHFIRALNRYVFPSFKPDLVHANVIYPSGVFAYFLKRKTGLHFILTEHWSKFDGKLSHGIYSRLLRKSLNEASFILPVSDYLKDLVLKRYPKRDCVLVIPNIIDQGLFRYHPKLNHDPNEVIFLSIMGLKRTRMISKRPELIIKALATIQRNEEKKLKLIIIGDGDRKIEYIKLSSGLGLEVEFPGYINKEQIPAWLQKSDFLVHPSEFETFGIAAIEAIKTGTPVIVSDLPVFRKIVNESNGVLADNVEESWVDGIKKAMSIKWNHEKVHSSLSDEYSYYEIGKQISEVYQKVVQQMALQKLVDQK